MVLINAVRVALDTLAQGHGINEYLIVHSPEKGICFVAICFFFSYKLNHKKTPPFSIIESLDLRENNDFL